MIKGDDRYSLAVRDKRLHMYKKGKRFPLTNDSHIRNDSSSTLYAG